jgi:hypothetical protein
MKLFKDFRSYENAHIALWLVKDCCWVSGWKIPGVLMIVPTLFVAIHIAWNSRKNIHDLFHNIAICFWIGANASWMLNEFFFEDHYRIVAKIFFAIGMSIIVFYYTFLFKKYKRDNLSE